MRHLCPSLLGLTLLASPSLAQTGLLEGRVVDEEGEPIPGAEVTVTSEELGSFHRDLETDDEGEFRLRFQPIQIQYLYEFLVEKPGYESFVVPLSPSATQRMEVEWVMHRTETEPVETHGDLGAVLSGTGSAAVDAFNEGLTAQREGDFATARERFEAALAEDDTLVPAHIALAQVYLDQEEPDAAAALASVDRALGLAPGRADALRVRVQALAALGRREEAAAMAEQLATAEDDVARARAIYNEGGEAFQAGDRETALAKFREAAELDPSLAEAHHAVATLELARGDHEAAVEAAEAAIEAGSDDVRTLRVLYDAYDALGRTDELARIAPRLAGVDPDFGAPKLLEQAAAQWNAGAAAEAVELSRLALSIDPNLGKAYYFIGLHHLSSGENAEAKAALEKFIELEPDDPEVATAREMLAYIE